MKTYTLTLTEEEVAASIGVILLAANLGVLTALTDHAATAVTRVVEKMHDLVCRQKGCLVNAAANYTGTVN